MQYIYLLTYSFIINDKIERSLILSTFSHLYFITSRFSIYGFPIYNVLFYVFPDYLFSYKFFRYLKDKSKIQLFESAHVVILAIFSTKKRISTKLSPFYCDLLLEVTFIIYILYNRNEQY